MGRRLWIVILLAGLMSVVGSARLASAQSIELSGDTPHPRLLLPARRMRLLERERERAAPRWQQLDQYASQGIRFPEPGFAHALHYAISGDESQAAAAIDWALGEGDDLRQLALVFDWCQPALSPEESSALQAKIADAIRGTASATDIETVRDRVLAIITIAGHDNTIGSAQLNDIVENWWRGRIVASFKQGGWPIARDQVYAITEILHAVRDNTSVDLRLDYRPYFAEFPTYALLSYYPALFPAPENDFHIPLIEDASPPDLRAAARTRAGDLAMVAYAPNDTPVQFLQGFDMFDQFLMRDSYGIPYEFLWANPYQPGLSYYNSPLLFHDPVSGVLIARTSWDGDAQWLYQQPGTLQTFSNGAIEQLTWDTAPAQLVTPDAVILPIHALSRFEIHEPAGETPRTYYLIGLDPHTTYDFEIDDEGLAEYTSDAGGIIKMEVAPGRSAGVRYHERPAVVAQGR